MLVSKHFYSGDNTLFASILNAFRRRRAHRRHTSHIHKNLTHISGPACFELSDEDICLIFVGRDIAYFADHFINHHRNLGAKYLIYIDNGSRDGSVEKVAGYDNAIVAQCTESFRDYQNFIREASATRYVRGGWRLALDPDELIDYPGSNKLSLQDLTREMAQRGHTGMVAQMLEMVPPGTLRDFDSSSFVEACAHFDSYSLGQISKYDYHDPNSGLAFYTNYNSVTDAQVKLMFGGIRRTLFGEDCCLSKHILFKAGKDVRPLWHPHVTTGLTLTDMTAVLKHYKFAGDYMQRDTERLRKNLVSHSETRKRIEIMKMQENLSFALPDSQTYTNANALLEQDFLVATQDWRALF